MSDIIDVVLVTAFFILMIGMSIYYYRKYKTETQTDEFLTGGRHMNWFQTAMALIGTMFDPGIMGNSALAFVWGFYIVQWNAVHIWFTAAFAGMFFIAIYWRSKITTTTEYLEKRFNYASRAVFSVIMSLMLISWLAYGVYMGGILLHNFVGWNLFLGSLLMITVCAFMVILGGVRTMLTMSVFQSALLIFAILGVGIAGFVLVGGFPGIREITALGKAGTPLKSLVPPMHFSPFSKDLYPFPAIPTFCIIAGLSWIVCNFSMAQRFLAAKDESHAQKALLVAGIANSLIYFLAYAVGIAMRKLFPATNPDDAFMQLLLKFPTGIKGLLLIGLIAALFSSKSGLLSATGSLLAQDIYARIINKNASEKQIVKVTRIIEFVICIIVLCLLPLFIHSTEHRIPAYEIILTFMGDVMGVIVAIFVLGIFSKRTTAWASFYGVVIASIVGAVLHYAPLGTPYELNFSFIGSLEFALAIIISVIGSRFEKPKSASELRNLTIWTLDDVPGPWVGVKSWPGLWKWAVILPIVWVVITITWQLYMKV